MTRDTDYLADILEAIDAVRRHMPGSEEELLADEVLQAAILRWVQIVGEAANGVSDELRGRHPEVPWRKIVDMRNLVAHGYRDVDLSIVWQAVARDLPVLEQWVRAILEEM